MSRAGTILATLLAAGCAGAGAPSGPDPGVDAEAAAFNDAARPYPERIEALRSLRLLRDRNPGEYRRAGGLVQDRLWAEASLIDGLSLNDPEEKSFVEAIGWLTDLRDPRARLKIELHLDRESAKRRKLPEGARCAMALGLGNYPASESARETLWAALKDPKEAPGVRSSCLKALQSHHPRDLEERVSKLPSAPGDEWLTDLQKRLR